MRACLSVLLLTAGTTGQDVIEVYRTGRSYTLSPGTHTAEVRAISVDPSAAAANVSSALAPQLQGVLTATIVRR